MTDVSPATALPSLALLPSHDRPGVLDLLLHCLGLCVSHFIRDHSRQGPDDHPGNV
jgi:hypothetical protein